MGGDKGKFGVHHLALTGAAVLISTSSPDLLLVWVLAFV